MEIKKELVINASISRVYDAITDMKQLSQWFPDVLSLEPKIGGKIIFRSSNSFSNISDIVEGKIIELEKNKKLVYTWSHPNVPNFPLTKVNWNLEQIEKNKTKVVIVHSGFIDEPTMNSYNEKWLGITKHLNIFTASKKSTKIQKRIVLTVTLASLCFVCVAITHIFQNSDEFVTGFFWISLLIITSLVIIPITEKYKKFSWRERPMVAAIGITCLAQVIVTVYWGLAFDVATMPPLIERLAIDLTLFYLLMISIIPIGFGISYGTIKFAGKSKTMQGTELVTIQISEKKINGLLISLVAFQVFSKYSNIWYFPQGFIWHHKFHDNKKKNCFRIKILNIK